MTSEIETGQRWYENGMGYLNTFFSILIVEVNGDDILVYSPEIARTEYMDEKFIRDNFHLEKDAMV